MPGPLLILDLSSALYVGLCDGSRVLARRVAPQGTRGENAHALVDACLSEAGLRPGDLTGIAVGVGPGSFTGIRVCGALAQGLAFARKLPLYPFSSLAALETCLPDPAAPAVSAIAANAGKYYVRVRGGRLPAADGAAAPAIAGPPEALVTSEALLALGAPAGAVIVSGNFPDRDRIAPAFGTVLAGETAFDFARVAALALSLPPVLDGVLRPNYLAASAAEDKLRAGLLGMRAKPGAPGTSP